MSKIGNYRVELQETDAYRWGWESAERGEPMPNWQPLNGRKSVKLLTQKLGWNDYHAQEQSK